MEADFQNLIKITKYEELGNLPPLLTFEDGTPVRTPQDWQRRREEIYRTAIELQYGQQPPKPEVLRIEPLGLGSRTKTYRIVAGPAGHTVSFRMNVFFPANVPAPWPVAVDGDLCWDYSHDKEFIHAFLDRGIALAVFDRTELASDVRSEGKRSPLYRAYPDLTFGALSAWAWGYHRCVDALLELGLADPNCIAFTGHSRGGKATLLAGALDDRAAIVNPNNSGCGGCGCHKVRAAGITEDGDPKGNETLEAIIDQFDYWFSPELAKYYGRAEELPFDQHFVKALVAPRILLEGNAASDLWANPVGSYRTAVAAGKAFRLLGAEKNHLWYYRRGYHWHKISDVECLAEVMLAKVRGTDFSGDFYQTPFHVPGSVFTE